MDKERACNSDCNNCHVVGHSNSRMITKILNELLGKFGDSVYSIVQENCPNLTVCYDCRLDDFCHNDGCRFDKSSVAEPSSPAPDLSLYPPTEEMENMIEEFKATEGVTLEEMRECPFPDIDCPACEHHACKHEDPVCQNRGVILKEPAPEENPEKACELEREAYGVRACADCERNCAVKDNNLNILANLEAQMQGYTPPSEKCLGPLECGPESTRVVECCRLNRGFHTTPSCDQRLTADHQGSKKGDCEACAVECPEPNLDVAPGYLCKWAEEQLE